jgi:phage terminase large subunit GpA-like protein
VTVLETHPTARAAWRARRDHLAAVTLAAPSRLTLSQWADEYRQLSPDLGEPGPWRTSRVPYLREPMDAITDPLVREVVVMKSARIGATQALGINAIGYYIHQEPSPIIAAFPTEGDATKFSKQLLTQAIDATPVLRERLSGNARDASDTILAKSYPGGTLQIVGTTSPRSMRMVHGRVVFGSEVDAWEATAGEDGDPITLLRKRADAYGSPKFVWESTPLVKGISRIEKAFAASDQRHYHVPCPHCGEYQVLEWGGKDVPWGVKWEDGDPTTVHYVCRVHGCVIEEAEKYRMVAAGRWVARNPESSVRGYHLNALVSPFPGARWSLLVDQWHDAQGKREQLKVFHNTVLGLTWEEEGEAIDADALASRLEEYPCACAPGERVEVGHALLCERRLVPAGVGVLTRSVDTQGGYLLSAVFGWGAGEECWLIDVEFLEGDPGTAKPWAALDEARARTYRHESGAILRPQVTFIDRGGHHSTEVDAYSHRNRHANVFAIFGATSERAPLLGAPTKPDRAKTIMHPVGSFAGKEALMARLRQRQPGPGFIHIPEWLDAEYLAQFTAEKLITRYVGGFPKRTWVKTRERNEMTDLWVYARAALHKLGPKAVLALAATVKQVQERGARESAVPLPSTPDPLAPLASRPAPRRGRGGFVGGWKR